jgi:hypothetical protein
MLHRGICIYCSEGIMMHRGALLSPPLSSAFSRYPPCLNERVKRTGRDGNSQRVVGEGEEEVEADAAEGDAGDVQCRLAEGSMKTSWTVLKE